MAASLETDESPFSAENYDESVTEPSENQFTILDNMSSTISSANYSKYIILKLCPEVGLAKQSFKCADCDCPIRHDSARLDDYDGHYYCYRCHTNDTICIPARIVHNWDVVPRPVSKKSHELITFIMKKPVLFDVLSLNSMLYGLVEELSGIKRLRIGLSSMVKYLRLCHQPNKPQIQTPIYLLQCEMCNLFALDDLINLEKLKKSLDALHDNLFNHITLECEGCKGKGYYCELCKDKGDLLFPFSQNVSTCVECGYVYHRSCFYRKHKNCYRCLRRRERHQSSPQPESESTREDVNEDERIPIYTESDSDAHANEDDCREESNTQPDTDRETLENERSEISDTPFSLEEDESSPPDADVMSR